MSKADIMARKWESLSKLRDHFDKTGEEKVVEFNGIQLVTKKHVYGLYADQLSRKTR